MCHERIDVSICVQFSDVFSIFTMLVKRPFEGWIKDLGFMKQHRPEEFWLDEKKCPPRALLTFRKRIQNEEHDHEFREE